MLRRALDRLAADAAVMFLADTLDWLNLWHSGGGELDVDPPAPPNHLFPQP